MRTWILPPGSPVPAVERRQEGALMLESPILTGELIRSVSESLKAARPALFALKTESILRAIEETVKDWSVMDYPPRREAEGAFRAMTGMPAITAPFGVPLEASAHGAVREWVRAEVEPPEALDGFVAVPGEPAYRLAGPSLAVFILPGNIPLTWLPAFYACLVGRTPCLIKPAEDDPITASAFVSTLIRRAPELASAIAVLPWKGGDEAVERAVLENAGAVVAWGGGESVSSLARRVPAGVDLLAHGPATAVGAVAREVMNPGRLAQIAADAARDTFLFDGRGCLSLSTIFIERGGLYETGEAVREMAKLFGRVAGELPPGRPSPEAASLVQSWRGRARARELAGKESALFASAGNLDWTVICDGEIPFSPVPLYRTLWIHPVDSLDDIPKKAVRAGTVHALAFAGPEARRLKLAGELVPAGLTRVCAFGLLQAPPISWSGMGVSPLRRLLMRTVIEK